VKSKWISLVEVPNGQSRIEFGSIRVATPHYLANDIGAFEYDGETGFSQGSFDEQLLFTNRIAKIIISDQMACSSGTGIDLQIGAPYCDRW
jgi:hypothetical protein